LHTAASSIPLTKAITPVMRAKVAQRVTQLVPAQRDKISYE